MYQIKQNYIIGTSPKKGRAMSTEMILIIISFVYIQDYKENQSLHGPEEWETIDFNIDDWDCIFDELEAMESDK